MKKIAVMILFAAISLSAQEAPDTPELTEMENLKMTVVLQKLLLANQRIQILQTALQNAFPARDARQQEFDVMLAKLRREHNTPEDKFEFNPNTMTFNPIAPRPEVVKEKEPEVKEE